MTTGESSLEMARRHVAEGKVRLLRQERLIIRLDQDGHGALLVRAHNLLMKMQAFQVMIEQRLAYLEASGEDAGHRAETDRVLPGKPFQPLD